MIHLSVQSNDHPIEMGRSPSFKKLVNNNFTRAKPLNNFKCLWLAQINHNQTHESKCQRDSLILKSQKLKSMNFFCLVQSMIDMSSGLLGWAYQIKEFKLDLSQFLAV